MDRRVLGRPFRTLPQVHAAHFTQHSARPEVLRAIEPDQVHRRPALCNTGLRWRTNNCYCCPPSVARTTAKLHNWAYSVSDEGLWVHLYGGNTLQTELPDGSPVALKQKATQADWTDKLYRPLRPRGLTQATEEAVDVTLIPYYAWANCGPSYMEVWIPLAR